ncbi:ABC transporter permease [Apilactobacillus xinyiensis]|uniref:ABC transporter permease n=1 Tax=Apilactobacillus xinyiensis TaxID=2841032 RepID=UPI00255551F4|nr:ABC transporter permease [Apilactobacillus xinyiensis]
MNILNKLWVIINETYKSQLKSFTFLISAFLPLIFAVLIMIPLTMINNNENNSESPSVALVSNQKTVRDNFIKNYPKDMDKKINNREKAQAAVKNGDIDGYIFLNVNNDQVKATYYGNDEADVNVKTHVMKYISLLQNNLNNKNANLNAHQAKIVNTQPKYDSIIHKHTVQKYNESDDAKHLATNICIFVMYFILIIYSSITAQTIANEKGSKIIEVIFSSTTAMKYFIGKIIAIAGLIMTQIVIYIISGLVVYQINANSSLIKDNQHFINLIIKSLLGTPLIYTVLGIILYVILSAVCGALVVKASDASKAAQPVVLISILGFVLSNTLQSIPNSLIYKICSYVPLLSNYFMPTRIINGTVGTSSVLISILILVATIVLITWFIGRAYKGLMLQNSNNSFLIRLRDGFRYK